MGRGIYSRCGRRRDHDSTNKRLHVFSSCMPWRLQNKFAANIAVDEVVPLLRSLQEMIQYSWLSRVKFSTLLIDVFCVFDIYVMFDVRILRWLNS